MHPTAKHLGLLSILACFAGFVPPLALAQSNNCAPRDTVVEQLSSKYGEVRKSVGLASSNSMIEVFASEATGSWTITVTLPNGTTCLMASGQSFETVQEVLPTAGELL